MDSLLRTYPLTDIAGDTADRARFAYHFAWILRNAGDKRSIFLREKGDHPAGARLYAGPAARAVLDEDIGQSIFVYLDKPVRAAGNTAAVSQAAVAASGRPSAYLVSEVAIGISHILDTAGRIRDRVTTAAFR